MPRAFKLERMTVRNTTVGYFLVIVFGICQLVSADYNCENGVYSTLVHVTEDCRVSSPSLRGLRKKLAHISGQDIVDTFEGYCRLAGDISYCVEDWIRNGLPCLRGEMATFKDLIRRSDWFCEGNHLKDAMKQIYQELPVQELDYNKNICYREAPLRTYKCIRRYLKLVSDPNDQRERMKKIISSFRCTVRKLSRRCSREAALLFATLEYDWVILPPALGINVAGSIIDAAKRKY